MTRARKVDPAILEREYIYDSSNPPISITGLADKYGMARSGIADKARNGHWYEKRQEFRQQLGEKVVASLTDEWAEFETTVRKKMMEMGTAYLDQYMVKLVAGEVKVSTRDALGIAAMLRTLIGDAAASSLPEHTLIDPEEVTLPPEAYRDAVEVLKRQLEAGEVPDADTRPFDADGDAEAGPEGTGED